MITTLQKENMKEKTKPICIRLPERWISSLKEKARETSYKTKNDVNFHDLIRDAIKNSNKELVL